MADTIHIPKSNDDLSNYPCWMGMQDLDGISMKPHIKCNCGTVTGIGLHEVHDDGRITASYLHTQGPDGCGWHVHLIMEDWDGGYFPPNSHYKDGRGEP